MAVVFISSTHIFFVDLSHVWWIVVMLINSLIDITGILIRMNVLQVNRDPMAAEMQRMRHQLEVMQAELICARGGGPSSADVQVTWSRCVLHACETAEIIWILKMFVRFRINGLELVSWTWLHLETVTMLNECCNVLSLTHCTIEVWAGNSLFLTVVEAKNCMARGQQLGLSEGTWRKSCAYRKIVPTCHRVTGNALVQVTSFT